MDIVIVQPKSVDSFTDRAMILVAPATADVDNGFTQQFTAAASDGNNNNDELDIYAIQVDQPENVIPVAAISSVSETYARFSPDSHWLAYHSDETGQTEVYVASLPEIRGKKQISSGGGFDPDWLIRHRPVLPTQKQRPR